MEKKVDLNQYTCTLYWDQVENIARRRSVEVMLRNMAICA